MTKLISILLYFLLFQRRHNKIQIPVRAIDFILAVGAIAPIAPTESAPMMQLAYVTRRLTAREMWTGLVKLTNCDVIYVQFSVVSCA